MTPLNSALMFSKASDEWSTPDALFAVLDAEFHFAADVAATDANKKVPFYFGLDHVVPEYRDALVLCWARGGPAWLNPPYSKCKQFIKKASEEAARGCTVVCLVPSRTDTRWWHEYVWDRSAGRARPGVEVRFLKGRLKFNGAKTGAPFPSVVIVFRPKDLR